MTMRRTGVILAFAAILGVSIAAAYPQSKAQGGQGWRKGQGWASFSAFFDTNKDGKVTKDEFLAKKPAFDHFDTNKDGVVTEAEFDANPASQKNPKLKGWIARFDTNKDRAVSLDEWNEARMRGFEAADTNKDGAIEAGEFTAELAGGGNN